MFESQSFVSHAIADDSEPVCSQVFHNATQGILHEIVKRASQEAARYNQSLQIQR